MKKILVVDENFESGAGISKTLENQGFLSQNMSDPDRAREAVGLDPFDLILINSEWGQKRNFSFELTSQLLDIAAGDPNIVLLSSKIDLPIFESHQAGASHVLKMPLDMDAFNEIIRLGPLKNSRRFERISVDEAGLGKLYGNVIIDESKHSNLVEVSNIGYGGFFLKVDNTETFRIGQVFEFEIQLGMVPSYQVSGKGIVRWSRNNGVGVEFLSLPQNHQATIQSFVDLFKVKEYVPTAR